MIELPISLVESNAMIIDFAGYPQLVLEFLILLRIVELEFVRLHIAHLLLILYLFLYAAPIPMPKGRGLRHGIFGHFH